MTAFLHRVLQYLQIILIPLFILGGSVRLITTERFLEFEYTRSNFPPDPFGFSPSQRLNLAAKNLDFVRDGLSITSLSQQELDGLPVYNPRELAHMQDVQDVYQAVWGIWKLSFAMLVVIGIIQWATNRNLITFADSLHTGGLLTGGLVVGIGLIASVGWQLWFELFHRFFFQPGTWLFDYSDTLIRLFPTQFWFDITMAVSAMSLTGAGLIAFVGWRLKLNLAIQRS